MNQNQNQQSSDGRHEDDTALSEFLASLMDYTPTVGPLFLSPFSLIFLSLFFFFFFHALFNVLIIFFFFQFQIPDELVEHYLAKSGFQCPDLRL